MAETEQGPFQALEDGELPPSPVREGPGQTSAFDEHLAGTSNPKPTTEPLVLKMGKYLPIVETELFRFFIDKGDQKCLCVDCGSDEVRNNEAEKNEHLWTKCPEWVTFNENTKKPFVDVYVAIKDVVDDIVSQMSDSDRKKKSSKIFKQVKSTIKKSIKFPLPENRIGYCCKECGSRFPNEIAIRTHFRKECPHTLTPPKAIRKCKLFCRRCNRIFSRGHHLERLVPDGCFVSDEIIKTIFRTACRKSKKKMEDGESSDKESRSKDGRSVSRPKAKGKTKKHHLKKKSHTIRHDDRRARDSRTKRHRRNESSNDDSDSSDDERTRKRPNRESSGRKDARSKRRHKRDSHPSDDERTKKRRREDSRASDNERTKRRRREESRASATEKTKRRRREDSSASDDQQTKRRTLKSTKDVEVVVIDDSDDGPNQEVTTNGSNSIFVIEASSTAESEPIQFASPKLDVYTQTDLCVTNDQYLPDSSSAAVGRVPGYTEGNWPPLDEAIRGKY